MRQLALLVVMLTLVPVQTLAATQPAQSPKTANGNIALTPALQDKVLGPNEKSTSFIVQLSNQTDKPINFSLSTTDFTALNQTGGLSFLGTDSARVTKGNGLSSILELEVKQLTVAANGSRAVIVRIADVSKLAPGGHYGAILAQVIPDGTSLYGNKVTVNQVVSSLIFLETAGQGTKTISLLPPRLTKVSFGLPQNIDLAFNATGNTQAVPRGLVTISRGDKVYMRGIVNENSSLILPKSTRLLPTELTGDSKPLIPGSYTVRVQYRFDGALGLTTYERTFLYVNIQAILMFILLIILTGSAVYKGRGYWSRRTQRPKMTRQANNGLIAVKNRSQSASKIVVRKGEQ